MLPRTWAGPEYPELGSAQVQRPMEAVMHGYSAVASLARAVPSPASPVAQDVRRVLGAF